MLKITTKMSEVFILGNNVLMEKPEFFEKEPYSAVREGNGDLKNHNSDLELYQIRRELTDGHLGCTQLLHQGGSSMEQRTPVSGANEEDLRPRLFEYEGLLCNRHAVSIEARDYENSTEAVISSGNNTFR